jgi:hypothetical protein
MEYFVEQNDKVKIVRSKNYNYNFDFNTGYFARWGKTKEDDPEMSPLPEILDFEITTSCTGPGGKLCSFCYKSNTPKGKNTSFETFKNVFDKINEEKILTQIAFGADATCRSNPDIWKMMEYCRANKVIPNITVADIDDETADKLAVNCGACAVSRYADKNYCYNSVEKLVKRGMTQCNIHQMISKETLSQAYETIEDYHSDPRLEGMNAIVFLSLKQKGRGTNHTPVSQEEFKQLVDLCFEKKINFGFDSCGANKFIKSIQGRENQKEMEMLAEPCESSCFSSYVDVDGKYFPCSFTPGTEGWEEGLDVVNCKNFVEDIWNHEKTINFRERLLKNCRNCPIYKV